MSETIKPFYLEHPIQVKSYDIDIVGHVNNIVYIRWLEDIRLVMLDEYLPFEELMAEDMSPVLLRTEIDYKVPIKMFDSVVARAYISELKGVRMTLDFEFWVGDVLSCTAIQKAILFHVNKERPCRPPKKFIEKYNSYFKD